MDVRNCKSCGRLFNYFTGQQFCPACMTELDEKFKLVKEYIYDHPEADVQEISTEFEVGIPIIHRWIREERLAFSENSPIGLACEGCRVTIKTGRYCKKCKDNLTHGFSNVFEKEEEPMKKEQKTVANPKMRFFK
ncbi:MAG: flagellar protein [bacterium]|nr:flagellar protein [bacterium]